MYSLFQIMNFHTFLNVERSDSILHVSTWPSLVEIRPMQCYWGRISKDDVNIQRSTVKACNKEAEPNFYGKLYL